MRPPFLLRKMVSCFWNPLSFCVKEDRQQEARGTGQIKREKEKKSKIRIAKQKIRLGGHKIQQLRVNTGKCGNTKHTRFTIYDVSIVNFGQIVFYYVVEI